MVSLYYKEMLTLYHEKNKVNQSLHYQAAHPDPEVVQEFETFSQSLPAWLLRLLLRIILQEIFY